MRFRFVSLSALLVAGGLVTVPLSIAGPPVLAVRQQATWDAGTARPPIVATRVPMGAHVPGWGFIGPDAMAVVATDVFVGNDQDDTVSELNARTGALVRVISGRRYQFGETVAMAMAMAMAGADVFVVSNDADAVTELNAATGALVRVISGSRQPNTARFLVDDLQPVYQTLWC